MGIGGNRFPKLGVCQGPCDLTFENIATSGTLRGGRGRGRGREDERRGYVSVHEACKRSF